MLLKLKLKGLIVYLIYNAILLTIAFLLNRFFQVLLFVLFFNFIQNCFRYRFHTDTLISNPIKAIRYCKLVTIIIEILYLVFCKDLDISIYSNLFIIFSIALVNCILEFSLEHLIITHNCLSNKDTLIELCTKEHLTESAYKRLYMKYIEHKTYEEIADLEFVSVETIKKSINRSRNKIFKS